MIYIDTSLLIALHLEERDSDAAWRWFASRSAADFLHSDWTDLEFSSALSRKVRSGKLSPSQRADVEAAFLATKTQNLRRVSFGPEHFRHAEIMVRLHETGLRAGDSLHLAIAAAHGAAIATFDTTLAEAAIYFGVPVERPT
jgi:uncharacterized protein